MKIAQDLKCVYERLQSRKYNPFSNEIFLFLTFFFYDLALLKEPKISLLNLRLQRTLC